MPGIYLVYTWYDVYLWFQPPLLLAVVLVVLVIGTPVDKGMTELEEDLFVCLACHAGHIPAICWAHPCYLQYQVWPAMSYYQKHKSQVCFLLERNQRYD
jgi:hypothetical protein